jgi:hypothetical protein
MPGLGRDWLVHAEQVITSAFGSHQKWQQITEGVWRYFQLQVDDPIKLSDIKRMGGELGVSPNDVSTVLQVLTNAEPPLIATTFAKLNRIEGEEQEVALGEVRQSLANLSIRGALGEHAEAMTEQVLVGWKPVMVGQFAVEIRNAVT